MTKQRSHSISQLTYVVHDDCEPWEDNPRTDPGKLDEEMRELVASISQHGVRQSVIVRQHPDKQDSYQIAAGARRWFALGHAIEAGTRPANDPLPARIEELDDFAMGACALEENLQRKSMSTLEEAEAYHRLALDARRGERVTEIIAQQVGKSQRHVQAYISLARDLSDRAKAALSNGRINIAHARVLTSIPKKEQDRFLHEAVTGQGPLRIRSSRMRSMFGGSKSNASRGPSKAAAGRPSSGAASPSNNNEPANRRRHAEQLRTSALSTAIAGKPTIALRLAALHFADRVRRLDREDLGPIDSAVRDLLDSESKADQWDTVASTPSAQLRKIVSLLVALDMAPKMASLTRPSALLPALTNDLKLRRVADVKLDDWLPLCSKKALLEVAVDSDAVPSEQVDDMAGMKTTSIRRRILASETRDPKWLPTELRFSQPPRDNRGDPVRTTSRPTKATPQSPAPGPKN